MGKIKILAMDIDGTLTNGKVYMGSSGELFKAFDIKDGYAIYQILPDNGIIPVVITGRESEIVRSRCAELGVTEVYQASIDKRSILTKIAQDKGLEIREDGVIKGCAFIGDDCLDIPGIEVSEFSGCPNDATEEVKGIVDYVCKKRGGDGAVREFVEWCISL